ncbi:MAG: hypothetical protein QNK27_07190 [Desulfuromusa sp.]|nr:hypothetical protein [Desulfuromusa sp.]
MKVIFRIDYLAPLIVALFLIVPSANGASINKETNTLQTQTAPISKKSSRVKTVTPVQTLQQPATAAEAKPYNPNGAGHKSPLNSRKKANFNAPGLKQIEAFKPRKTQVGIPQIKIKPGGLGDIPVPNDMEVGITLPGSESSTLTVGSPGDSYEREADRVADSVMRPKSNPALLPGSDVGKIPETDPAGPVSNQSTPGSEVGLDPRDDPGGPVSGLGSPGGAVSLDPRDDPMGPVSVGQQ